MIGINSNNIQTHPQDAPDKMIASAEMYGWDFPYLFDETQETAKAFAATCTPDVFMYDSDGKLYYRGQLDDSRPNQGESDGRDLKNAIDSMIACPVGRHCASVGGRHWIIHFARLWKL